jgi:arabinoxylan arabinofuranohydrolase
MKTKIKFILVLFFVSSCIQRNPIITNMYTADPSARVFNDTLYLYPSHDRDSAVWWDMDDWHVFSTTDMKHWTDHGVVLSLKDLIWAKEYAWAPDCNYKNGKYYFYYPTDQDYIGVAVGDHPTGPFKDPIGKPLISRQTPGVKATRDLIDPCIFVDDDGQGYLFFGQNDVNVIRLNDDMISFNDSAMIVKGTDHFFEAVWVHKRNGMYYISYSGLGKILYGMSDHPLGPYTYKGEILDTVNSGTNHHSIVEYKGTWYFFYHNADLSEKNIKDKIEEQKYSDFRRSVCVEYLYYNEDGTIQKISQTKKAVKPI